jgi:hypothetical protein
MNSRVKEHAGTCTKESGAYPKCDEEKLSIIRLKYDFIVWKTMLWNHDSI